MGTCECERIGDVWVVRLHGHFLTEEDAALVRGSLLDPTAVDARCVVVNWADVRFMNSMILGAVIWSVREIMARGGSYRNCGLPDRIHYALRGIKKIFDWQYYASEEEAIHSCTAGAPAADLADAAGENVRGADIPDASREPDR